MIKLNPRALLCLILAGILTQSPASIVYGQSPDDDLGKLFEDEDFDDPTAYNQFPPPPPPTDFGNSAPPGFPVDSQPSFEPPPPPPSGNSRSSPTARGGNTANPSRRTPSPTPPAVTQRKSGTPSITDAQIEDITSENYPDLIESFDYPNAEVTDVIKAISQLTGKNFIIDPGVRGKISIIAPTQISVAEAYKAFLSALAINGFTVVPSGKFLKVKSARNAQRDSIETYSGKYYPNADVMITRIVHLKHTSADAINKNLRILPSKDGEMTPYEPTNSLIISDYGSNVERIMKIINEIDRPGFEEQLNVIPIRYARAKDLADLINQIINKETTRGGAAAGGPPGFGAGVPRFRGRGGPGGSNTPEELSLVAPDERTNALIVVGNQAGIAKVRNLVRRLDYKLDPAEAGGVFVYYVKYGEAEKIAQTLSGLAGGGGAQAGGGGAPGAPPGFGRPASPLDRQAIFGGDVRISHDKNTNSLVITASKPDYETVLNILQKLDIPKDQVYVEAVIMEMNSQRQNAWNPTYYRTLPNTGGVGRAGFSGGNLAGILNPAGDRGVVLGFGQGEIIEVSVGGSTVRIPSLLAFLTFIQQNVESNILSTPQILALDNEEAMIEVGDKIPIAQDQTATGNTVSTNTRFENASIKLTITPFIRPDSNVVRMKVDQSVKQPTRSQAVGEQLQATTTVISDRTIKTNITVHSGDTAVLGGLIRDQEALSETKVPILGDIPILGWLFKSRSVETNKINLVVFLTPKIIRSLNDSQQNLTNRVNDRIDWLKKNFGGRDPYGKKVDTFPRADRADGGTGVGEPITRGGGKTNEDNELPIR
jgi:general secretion pathway protein D